MHEAGRGVKRASGKEDGVGVGTGRGHGIRLGPAERGGRGTVVGWEKIGLGERRWGVGGVSLLLCFRLLIYCSFIAHFDPHLHSPPRLGSPLLHNFPFASCHFHFSLPLD